MNEHEMKWLKLLKSEGPQLVSVLFTMHPKAASCLGKGWTKWSGDLDEGEHITAAGIAALEAASTDLTGKE